MTRSLSGGMTAVAGFTALAVSLAAIDERVRDQLALMINGRGPSAEVISAGNQINGLISVVAQAIRDQSMEHAPLVIFALAALVLVLFMLRT
jgi:hypothetical protein